MLTFKLNWLTDCAEFLVVRGCHGSGNDYQGKTIHRGQEKVREFYCSSGQIDILKKSHAGKIEMI